VALENDLPDNEPSRRPQKSTRSWIFLLARWAAASLILGVLLYLLPLAPLRNALSRVPLTRFIAVLLIYLLVLTGGITKWHTVVNSAGAQLSLASSAECYTSGLFGALFLPSIIGGDVARLAVGISHSPRPAAVITGNVADRFLDVAAELTLVSLGVALLPGLLPVPWSATAKQVLLAGVLGAAILFLFAVYCADRCSTAAPSVSGAGSRNLVTRSAPFGAVPGGWFWAGCWALPCRAVTFCSPRFWAALVDSVSRCRCGSWPGHLPKSPRSCRLRKAALGFARRRW